MKRLTALALVAGCATPTSPVLTAPLGEGGTVGTGTVSAPSPIARLAAPRPTPSKAASRSRGLVPHGSGSQLNSTAYCETGLMANGHRTYRGAVAANVYKLGTRLRVSDSPSGPGIFTVVDRIGHSSSLDFAMPGDCVAARQWGRRDVRVEVVR